MDFTLSAEQTAIRDAGGAVAQKYGAADPGAGIVFASPAARDALWTELAKAGVLGAGLPEQYGGTGGGALELAVLLEELGRNLAPAPVLESIVSAQVVGAFGSEAQRARWLSAVVEGSAVLTLSAAAHDLTATREGGGWRVSGRQVDVCYAAEATRVLLIARAGDTEVGLLVDPAANGVTLQSYGTTSDLPEAEIVLQDVLVGDADAFEGAGIAEWARQRVTVATSALLTGIGLGALEMTARHTNQRHQFGRPLSAFQAVAVQAGGGYIDVDTTRLALWQAAWRLDDGRSAEREVAIAKFWASEATARVTATAQHLHGAVGVTLDYPLHHFTLWSKHLELSAGSAREQLNRIAGLSSRHSAII